VTASIILEQSTDDIQIDSLLIEDQEVEIACHLFDKK
jgi:hypothetical protein